MPIPMKELTPKPKDRSKPSVVIKEASLVELSKTLKGNHWDVKARLLGVPSALKFTILTILGISSFFIAMACIYLSGVNLVWSIFSVVLVNTYSFNLVIAAYYNILDRHYKRLCAKVSVDERKALEAHFSEYKETPQLIEAKKKPTKY